MTNKTGKIQQSVAPLYSLRNWIEYGFKQIKDELGWADFRVTDYASLERWWEIVISGLSFSQSSSQLFLGTKLSVLTKMSPLFNQPLSLVIIPYGNKEQLGKVP